MVGLYWIYAKYAKFGTEYTLEGAGVSPADNKRELHRQFQISNKNRVEHSCDLCCVNAVHCTNKW